MSVQFSKVCSLILLEHFGEIVEKVGSDLFQWGPKPLGLIAASTKLSVDKVSIKFLYIYERFIPITAPIFYCC